MEFDYQLGVAQQTIWAKILLFWYDENLNIKISTLSTYLLYWGYKGVTVCNEGYCMQA